MRQIHLAQRTGMLGLAMLLVGTGTECASAAPELDKMKSDEAEKRHQFAQHIEGAYGTRYAEAAQRVVEDQSGEAVCRWYRNGVVIREVRGQRLAVSLIESPPFMRIMPLVACPEAQRPPAKPRSKSGQRRAHARRGR